MISLDGDIIAPALTEGEDRGKGDREKAGGRKGKGGGRKERMGVRKEKKEKMRKQFFFSKNDLK